MSVENIPGFKLLTTINLMCTPMHPCDKEKTIFITLVANYCYNVMSFGLKNIGATY